MISQFEKRSWQKAPIFSLTQKQEIQAQKFDVHPLIIHILALRGISGDEQIEMFLNPALSNLPEPFTMSGMKKAVCLVSDAIQSNSKIVIWGDYDVDGVTSTCLLIHFFNKIGVEVKWNIPDRFSDGYGLNCRTIQQIRSEIQDNSPLLITVDCGISNHREILEAKKLGFRTIVTDHHEPPEHLVAADTILNVKLKGCTFKDSNLAGVGTAFYLIAGIRSHLKKEGFFQNKTQIPNLKQFLDFAAIGTIADMVPLTGVNRILVKAGFEVLDSPSSAGLSALLKSSDILPGTITSEDISFQIAPRINAAGRLGKVSAAMNLLLCNDSQKAIKYAHKLSDINDKRKKICRDMLESTLSISNNTLLFSNNCIIISGEFHLGVLGIVASQLANMHQLPVILFGQDTSESSGVILKGSGRSVPGVDLMKVLRQCERYLIKYGGHTMAAGLSIHQENLEMFRKCFSGILDTITAEEHIGEKLLVDAEFSIEQLFEKNLLEQFKKLEPFGVGNTRPIFSDTQAFIFDYQSLGRNGDHLKLYFRGKYANRHGIGFNLGHRREILQKQRNHTVIYSPTLNRHKNSLHWEAKLFDVF